MVERKLCEIYNVSRSPIRNALQQLTHEGLLSFVPGKGTVVASFSTDDILEVYDLIELLQDYAIKACINKQNALVVNALEMALNNMKTALEKDDIFHFTAGIRNSINYWSAILETNVWKRYMIS